MDPSRIIAALSDTLAADRQEHGAKLLTEMHKIIGFVPTLLNIVLEQSLDVSVRQAAALYLKNNISEFWKNQDEDKTEELKFSIHEQDKQLIRNSIVAAVVSSPIPLQSQLKVALSKIIKNDFPTPFEEFPEQVKHFLLSSDHSQWHGALVCIHQFVKNYEYKKSNERVHILPSMRVFLPILNSAMVILVTDRSETSRVLQTLVLKIFFAFTNFHFPLDFIEKEALGQWFDVFCSILSDFENSSTDPDNPTWKRKKWALKIILRISTRYGSPGVVIKKHRTFAEWYLKAFTNQIVSVLLNICEAYRQKTFVSESVLSQTLEYFSYTLGHSFSWKILRPHFSLLVREIIFPLLSYSDEDAELWQEDPVEYIRCEAVDWGFSTGPSETAFTLLNEACVKRRGVLNDIMPFCIQILTSDSSPVEKDAVLHMYGAIAEILLKKEIYRNQLEPFLMNHVLPTLRAPEGYRRARACWLLGKLAESTFNNENVFAEVVEEVLRAACFDAELPVRAFAALCLYELIRFQESAHKIVAPHLHDLLIHLLKLLRDTEFDDLNEVIERLINTFEEEIAPIAADLMQNLSETFVQLAHVTEDGGNAETDERGDTDESYELRSIVATSVLNNMESILQVTEEREELQRQLEPIVVNLIQFIFKNNLSIFYDEALTLQFSLTSKKISPLMWELFTHLYPIFQKDAGECFSEMMPVLHNYMTVDRETFLSNQKHIETIATMCSEVIQSDEQEETSQMNAAKILEVFLLDYRGQIDQYVPKFIELALARLNRPIVSSELRTMCLQVMIASFLYSPVNVLQMMTEHHWPGTDVPILNEFLKRWLHDTDCFLGLHDRRLCVLGLCLLLSLPASHRPLVVETAHKEYMPALLLLFSGLKRAYAVKAKNQNEDDSSEENSETEDDLEGKALDTDEDEVDEESARYLEMLEADDEACDDDDNEDAVDEDEETTLEAFDTQIDKPECDMDEYLTFYRIMMELERTDAVWYTQLISHLTETQQTELKEVVDTAVKWIQQKESKLIEQAGGYIFRTTIPSSFDFGSPPPPNGHCE